MEERTCKEFLDALASSAPTPGGGGAAAFAGSLGVALGAMVGNLTSGKKKYAAVQSDIERMLTKAETLYKELYGRIAQDAADFQPLADAYRLPEGTPEEKSRKEEVMETALAKACETPLSIMRLSMEGLQLQEEMAEKGTVMAISDVGAGAALLQGAIKAASLNIYINAGSMKDREKAKELLDETDELMQNGSALAEQIFAAVKAGLM